MYTPEAVQTADRGLQNVKAPLAAPVQSGTFASARTARYGRRRNIGRIICPRRIATAVRLPMTCATDGISRSSYGVQEPVDLD